MSRHEWALDHSNFVALARALVESGHIPNLDIMLEYIEKPYKWTAEWEYYAKHGHTENHGDE